MTDDERELILSETNSFVVFAGAGTGKTTLLVKKIENELKNSKTFKKIAAVTFTVKATSELKNRLSFLQIGHYIGTINRFAISEVIQPFFKDVFGNEYNNNFVFDYNLKMIIVSYLTVLSN